MNLDKIFDIRFTAPVGIMVFFLFLYSPKSFANQIDSFSSLGWVLSIVGILGIGVTISSITNLIVRLRGWHVNDKFQYILSDLLKFDSSKNTNSDLDLDHAKELSSWLVLDLENKSNSGKSLIPEQINKRWSMAMASFNSLFGVLFGIIISILFLQIDTFWSTHGGLILYFLVGLIFILIFGINGYKGVKSVRDMDFLLALKHVKIKE